MKGNAVWGGERDADSACRRHATLLLLCCGVSSTRMEGGDRDPDSACRRHATLLLCCGVSSTRMEMSTVFPTLHTYGV